MTGKKLFVIIIIFAITCAAWMILAGTNRQRTDSGYYDLKKEVAGLYGENLVIKGPECFSKTEASETTQYEIVKSVISVRIKLDPRKKGNLWFPTFRAKFSAEYEFRIGSVDPAKKYYIRSTLESADSIYNDISLAVDGKQIDNVLPMIKKLDIPVQPLNGGVLKVSVSYDATGMDDLTYYITEDKNDIAQINDFTMTITTDFPNYDFPAGLLSPTTVTRDGVGRIMTWALNKAVTGKDIGLVIPNKLNPGQIVSKVTLFAPVSLLFFFTVIIMLSFLFKVNFHPMHYFFLAATFFSFHLMYSYFSDHMDIYLTFAISSAVSLLLTVTYMRLFAPPKIAFLFAPLTQFVYLVVFSFSFFFKGMTGLIVTVCAVLTLFILMQITGKLNWEEAFKGNKGRKEPSCQHRC